MAPISCASQSQFFACLSHHGMHSLIEGDYSLAREESRRLCCGMGWQRGTFFIASGHIKCSGNKK